MPPRHRPYPTLQQRIIASRQCIRHSPIMRHRSGLCYLLDPVLARSVLAKHELCTSRDDGSSDDDNDKSPTNDEDDANANMKNMYANLEKPNKPTVLLHDALTNANGEVWHRQRYCVSRAFAVNKATRKMFASIAVSVALDLMNDLLTRGRLNTGDRRVILKNPSSFVRRLLIRHEKKHVVDVRDYAKEVAIHTLCRIVFGQRDHKAIILLLRKMFHDSLEPRRDEERSRESKSIVMKLDMAVRETIEDISKDSMSLEDSADQQTTTCLVERLLLYSIDTGKEKDNAGEYYLTKDEIVGNTHSAILAGIQTISTTLAGALLHLAERPQLQTALAEESITGKEIVNETLRILPPVSGLPRVPRKSGVEISTCPNVSVKKDHIVVIDVLAFAHAQPHANGDEPPRNTLVFDLTKKRQTKAAPWGIGKRSCPAGIISTECISAILQALAEQGIAWSFANQKKDWLETVSYRPTLTYSCPLVIRFCAKTKGDI